MRNSLQNLNIKVLITGQCLGSSRLDPENNPDSILSQEHLYNILSKYGFPPNVEVRLPHPRDKADSSNENLTFFNVIPIHLGLRFTIGGSLRDLLIHYDLAPTQFMPNTWRTLMALIILAESISVELSYKDIMNLFTLSENGKDF